jgi:ABC-type transport system involved in cytochrome c biogenesis permease subunit
MVAEWLMLASVWVWVWVKVSVLELELVLLLLLLLLLPLLALARDPCLRWALKGCWPRQVRLVGAADS